VGFGVYRLVRYTDGDVTAASRSTVAVAADGDRLCELQRQVRTCQRQLSQLYQRVARDDDDDDDERRAAALGDRDAPPRGTGRSTFNGRAGRGSGSRRHHECRLRTLDEKVDRQQLLLLRLLRQQSPLNGALLDDMYQQQKRIAEVS